MPLQVAQVVAVITGLAHLVQVRQEQPIKATQAALIRQAARRQVVVVLVKQATQMVLVTAAMVSLQASREHQSLGQVVVLAATVELLVMVAVVLKRRTEL
jgi:hypothetical protein